ncbi:MAG: phosphotransferase family protein [Blastocatellia bacterium]|nr:phosphotransferase family protein [Blastocatellia bacterium]
MDFNDRSRPVRAGEELDQSQLESYLKTTLPQLSGPLVVEQFPSGYSNLTYLLKVGDTELVLRRPPFGAAIKTAHDMGREFRILSRLIEVFGKVPKPLAYCTDETVLGAPFYVMERVHGIILRAKPPAGMDLTPDLMRRLSTALVDSLAEMHSLDVEKTGLSDLGKPAGYVERQVRGWTERYFKAKTDEIPEIEAVTRWLAERIPGETGSSLIHNDYKYDNVVLDPLGPARILAVLDWEMATIGDPLMDLGTTLGYWIDPTDPEELLNARFGLTTLPGNLSRQEIAARYGEMARRDMSNVVFYYVFGLFKIAVIVQQIYARYKKGFTKDERFATLDRIVRALGIGAFRASQTGKL